MAHRLPTEIIFQIIASTPSSSWCGQNSGETAALLRMRLICKSIDRFITNHVFRVIMEVDNHFMSNIVTFRHLPTWFISQSVRENINAASSDVDAMDDVTSAAYHAVKSADLVIPNLACEFDFTGWSQERLWSMVSEIFHAWGPNVYHRPHEDDDDLWVGKFRISGNNLAYARMDPFHYLFLLAAYQGENGLLKHLLRNHGGLDINFFHSSLGNALFLASYKGYTCIVQLLLEHGYDVNHKDAHLHRTLECVIHKGRLDILQLIAPKMKDTKPCGCGQPLLLCAVNQQNQNILQVLLDNLPGVNDTLLFNRGRLGRRRFTALEYAIAQDLPDHIVKLLLESERVDPNAGAIPPIQQAISRNRPSVVKMLLQHPEIDLKREIASGATPLSTAATCGNLEYVELLVQHGSFGIEDLKVAIERCCGTVGDPVYIIRLFYERYPAVRPLFGGRESGKWVVLATEQRNTDIVKFLLQHGANPNHVSVHVSNPLTIAILAGSRNIVDLLMQRDDIDVNAVRNNRTPLIAAIVAGDYRVVKILLQRPDIIINRELNQAAPLPSALMRSLPSITRLLIDHPDVDVNQPDKLGFTPIQLAVQENQSENVELLLARGVRFDANAGNWRGIMNRMRTRRWTEMLALLSAVPEGRRLLEESNTG